MNVESKSLSKKPEIEQHFNLLLNLTQKAVNNIIEFDPKINKIILFGSLARYIKYQSGGFSIFSDADIAVFPSIPLIMARKYYRYRDNLRNFLQSKGVGVVPQHYYHDPEKQLDIIVISDYQPFRHFDKALSDGLCLFDNFHK